MDNLCLKERPRLIFEERPRLILEERPPLQLHEGLVLTNVSSVIPRDLI